MKQNDESFLREREDIQEFEIKEQNPYVFKFQLVYVHFVSLCVVRLLKPKLAPEVNYTENATILRKQEGTNL